MEDLSAQRESIIDLIPQRRANEAVVLVAGSWIDPVTTATVGSPTTEILLKPDRQEDLRMSGAEAGFLIADRDQDLRIDRHLWEPVVLARRNEAIFCAELDILQGETGVAAVRGIIALWNEYGKLEV